MEAERHATAVEKKKLAELGHERDVLNKLRTQVCDHSWAAWHAGSSAATRTQPIQQKLVELAFRDWIDCLTQPKCVTRASVCLAAGGHVPLHSHLS